MYATSNSARAPAARSLAAVWTELPRTYFTVAPVAFSNVVAWHFFELSTKVPPNVATTSSSPDAGSASPAMSRQISRVICGTIMIGGSSRGAWCWDYNRWAAATSSPVHGFSARMIERDMADRQALLAAAEPQGVHQPEGRQRDGGQ